MTDRWQLAQDLFGAALKLPAAEREAFLRRSCGSDAGLLDELRALLRHDDRDGPTVNALVGRTADRMLADQGADAHTAWVGRRLGAWRIVAHVADGGMGAVYRAKRDDGQYEQTAAVKLIAPALMSPQSQARLAGERQILARLAHPHIARLLDGGTSDDGVPYLVMEYIDGVPIDVHCRAAGLDTSARLRLFRHVCDAVEYAHRNLVVHRDLKPSNILVQPDGTPKLLDFGIAKLMEGDADLTRADQRLLTPSHASPEQIRGEPVTTATDVYALGVLLYELVAGVAPFPATGRTPSQVVRDVLESEPTRPSHLPGPPDAVRRRRRELAGDIDNIVLMALRKEPARRYGTVQALADDIERHLADQPVSARPDTFGYRTAKFLRRRRAPVLATAVAALAGAAMVAFYTWQLQQERDRAQLAALQSRQVAEFMSEVFRVARPDLSDGRDVTARELLDNAARKIEGELAEQPVVMARMLVLMGNAYQALGRYPESRSMYERGLQLTQGLAGAGHPDALEVESQLGLMQFTMGEYDASIERLERVLAGLRRPDGPPRTLKAARALRALGVALFDTGKDQRRGLDLLREAVTIGRQVGAPAVEELLLWKAELGELTSSLGDPRAGLAILDEAVADAVAVHGEQHARTIDTRNKRARTLVDLGRLDEAVRESQAAVERGREVYGPDHARVANMESTLGMLLLRSDRHAEAERAHRDVTRIFVLRHGADHPRTVFSRENTAHVLLAQGRDDEAIAIYEQTTSRVAELLGADNLEHARSLSNLAGAYMMAGQPRKVLQVGDRYAAAFADESKVPDDLKLRLRLLQAEALFELGRPGEAQTALDGALPLARELGARVVRDLDSCLVLQARLHLARGQVAQAVPLLDEVLARVQRDPADRSTYAAGLHSVVGELLVAAGDVERARPLIEAAAARLHEVLGPDHRSTKAAMRRLQALPLAPA